MVQGKELDASMDCFQTDISMRSSLDAFRLHLRDSDAISDSRKRPTTQSARLRQCTVESHVPGMMYVNDRSADSICDTELAFLRTKSSYMLSHLGGNLMILGT